MRRSNEDLLCRFWEELFVYTDKIRRHITDTEMTCDVDDSEYVFVDGEEGDYGKVKYHNTDGRLIAVRIIHGGDDEDITFTMEGKEILKEQLREAFERMLSEI